MAKYEVKCDECNQEVTIELFGKIKKREWILENRMHLCKTCWQKKQNQKSPKVIIFPKIYGEKKGYTLSIINSYQIKEELKKIGYRWNPDDKGWQKDIDEIKVKKEVKELKKFGCELQMANINSVLMGGIFGTS